MLFPNVVGALRESGLDPATELIPVSPASHFCMGGVVADLDGASSVPGLYVVGETACTGLHGANRLASNSLTECFVQGKRAALAGLDEPRLPVAPADPPLAGPIAPPRAVHARGALAPRRADARRRRPRRAGRPIRIHWRSSSPHAPCSARRAAERISAATTPRRIPPSTATTPSSATAAPPRSSPGPERRQVCRFGLNAGTRLTRIQQTVRWCFMRPGHDAGGRGGSQSQGQGEVSMYQFSRAMYRELAKDVDTSVCEEAHHHVLLACEQNIERLVGDRHYFARPARTLFKDIRRYFPMTAQPRVWTVVQRYVACTEEWMDQPAPERHRRQRPAAAVPRHDPPRHRVPADAAAAQRLLPVAPAPRRDRGSRRARGHRRLRRHPSLEAAPDAGRLKGVERPASVRRGSAAIAWRADAAGGRRRRDLHRRRAGRRRAADHGQGADDARGPVARRARRGARGAGGRGRAQRRRRGGLLARDDGRDQRAAGGRRRADRAVRHRGLRRRRRARPPGAAGALPAVRGPAGAARAAAAARRGARSAWAPTACCGS